MYNQNENQTNYQPDYSKMTIREEIEDRFKRLNMQQNQTPMPVDMEFDGQNLSWVNDNSYIKPYSATSGRNGYNCRDQQNIQNKGPIPEGIWYAKQDQYQNRDNLSNLQKIINPIGFGAWPGGESAWGNHRVWLQPAVGTNTYQRTGFSIHGGKTPGSAGCIDLTNDMDRFANDFKNYNKDVRIRVKYPKDCW